MHQINTSRSKRLYLYIGCGSDRILNFTHMDYSVAKASKNGVKVKQPEIFGDLRSGIPVLNHSVDLIYTIHTFERLTVSDSIDVLRNCRNKLKVGGVIRIVVTDFEEMINDFHKQTPVIQSNWEINANFPINTPTELFIARILYPDHKYLLNFGNSRLKEGIILCE